MTTAWTVTAGSPRVALDPGGRAQVTFTVTNGASTDDRAVFDVTPGENTDRAWFTVDEPQRPVPHGGSVPFLVTITVPATAAPGDHWLAGRVYSADSAPEESSAVSNRVAFEVAPAVAPPPRRIPWLWVAVAALVVAVIVAVVLVTRPSPPPVAQTVPVPDLTGLSLADAIPVLRAAGLEIGDVPRIVARDRPDGLVLGTMPQAGTTTERGTRVIVFVSAGSSAPPTQPTTDGPPPGPQFPEGPFTFVPLPDGGFTAVPAPVPGPAPGPVDPPVR